MDATRLVPGVAAPPPCKRALVVEREFEALTCVRAILVAANFEVHCAGGPGEARRLLAAHDYDVVVANLELGSEGRNTALDIVACARERNPMARLVVLANGACDLTDDERASFGAVTLRPKAGDFEMLREHMDTIVRTSAETAPW